MSNCKEKLFSEFKAPTKQEWMDKIQVDLKGADFNKRLVWRTNEGFDVPPFYMRDDVLKLKTPDSLPGEFPYVRGNKKACNCWYVRQDIMADDAKAANAKVLDLLKRGVDSLGFKIPGDCVSAEFVGTLLEGIDCEAVELNFNTCKRHTLELATVLAAYFDKKGCDKASRPLVDAVIALRLVKEDREIEQIEHACDIGYEMHTAARRGITPGIIEQEIVGRMEGVTLSKGWGVSFATILTQHGEIFHCHSHDCVVEPGRLMVIDAGAENNMHYASDFTRTYPTGGRFSAMQRDIYQTVYECNELAFGMIRPGVAYRDVHLAVAAHMLDNLGQLGLVSGDPAELAEQGIAGLFMPHGLGHNMGLDVHDMEDLGEDLVGYDPDQSRSALLGLGSLRMARRLAPGNVITDEPGIYFIPDLIRLWKREGTDRGCVNYNKLEPYFSFGGIRLEDDVLVTAGGARRLGARRLPIAPDDVEAAMSKDQS